MVHVPDRLDRWAPITSFPAPGSKLRCGVSGGADSLALMALAVAAGCEVTAVHVDHGQRAGSVEESVRVAALAAEIGANFESAVVDVESGSNLEARMRAARYEVLGPNAATGHTMDDQAETVMINLMRGAGLRGLGAMQHGHRRPILRLRRTDTEAVCAQMGWEPFSDPSNSDPAFVRNRVRAEALPLLNDIANRDVVPLLARTSENARSASEVIAMAAAELDPTDAPTLAVAPDALAAEVIQAWIQHETNSDYPVDRASVERVLRVAKGDAIAAEVTGGFRVSRSRQRLRLENSEAPTPVPAQS